MHVEALVAMLHFVGSLPTPPMAVYEIGSRHYNGSVRFLFPQASYHGIDLKSGSGVDAVADGTTYQPPFTPDCVVCCEVFEHTPKWPALVAQAYAVLAPGGHLLVTCAGPLRPPHGDEGQEVVPEGEYYQGVTQEALAAILHEVGFVGCQVLVPAPRHPHTNLHAVYGPEIHSQVAGMDVYAIGRKP